MAGLLNNILGYLKLGEDDEYDDDYMDDYEEEELSRTERRSRRTERSETAERKAPRKSYQTMKEDSYEDEIQMPRRERTARVEKSSKVIPMRTTSKGLEVCIMKPTSFEDSQEVCNILLSGRAVVVNLEGFDADDAQRIMDFISGCIFAINGKLHRISKYIFIFSPDSVDISGDYLDILPADRVNSMTINREF